LGSLVPPTRRALLREFAVLLLLLTTMTCQGGTKTFDCGPLRLGFDSDTGQWTHLSLAGRTGNLLDGAPAADLDVEAADAAWPAPGEWQVRAMRLDRGAGGLAVLVGRAAGDWDLTEAYEVDAHAPVLTRRATLHYVGKGKVRLRATHFLVPGVTLGGAADAAWSIPGNYPVRKHALRENVPGREVRETGWTWSDTGVAYVRSAASRIAALVSYHFEEDKACVKVEEKAGAVSLVHDFGTVADLAPGDTIELGRQLVAIASGGPSAFRAVAQDLATRANPAPPADRPEWLEGAVIEEAHPWGRLETWNAGDRGHRMPDLTAQLPYLRDLGVDAVWVLPVSNKPPWVYALPAFGRLDPEVTTADQLKDLLATAHRLGMHALLDLVVHGLSPDSPDVATLPDTVWCKDEKGERQKAWGGAFYAADCSSPDWQARTRERVTHWVRDFGFDGFRLDCAGLGQSLNFRPQAGLRFNRSVDYGGVCENAMIRRTIRAINPDAVLLIEGGTPLLLRCGDIIHDYPLHMVMREITRDPDTTHWVAELRRFLAAQQLTYSPAMMPGLLRFTENHDVVAAQEFYGVGPSQALTALCAFLPGTMLPYQEQEIGYSAELADWLRCRHGLPELRGGAADYGAVEASDPHVLAFLRSTEGGASVVAINFSDREARCRLKLAPSLLRKLPIAQAALATSRMEDGERLDLSAPVVIPPWRPVVITLRAEPRKAQPSATRSPSAATGTLVLETTSAQGDGAVTRTTLRLAPVVRWFVRTPEGLLTDRFVDRHRKTRPGESLADAMPPLGRAWRPVESRLWDGPGERALGAVAADGRWVEVVVDAGADIRQARIDDPSSVGREVTLSIVHTAGATPFRVIEGRLKPGEVGGGPLSPVKPPEPFVTGAARVEVGPLFVRATNGHYEAVFARRHGGTIASLRHSADLPDLLAGGSEVYTDWGLYEKGVHVSTECETSPSLSLSADGDAAIITFTGALHGPSWNGVQSGYIVQPRADYRITYRVDASPSLRVGYGLTPSADWRDVSAFLAYRIPFGPVVGWRVEGAGREVTGRPGERPAEVVFQAEAGAVAGLTMRLSLAGGAMTIRSLSGEPLPPDRPFLYDSGAGTLHLFATILNGTETSLPVGRERSGSFDLTVE